MGCRAEFEIQSLRKLRNLAFPKSKSMRFLSHLAPLEEKQSKLTPISEA